MNASDCQLSSFEQKLLEQLQLADATRHLVVALSGGVDSKSLLHALVQLRSQGFISDLSAIHVNHGLQMQADEWLATCERDCQAYQVPLQVESYQLAKSVSRNLESEARDARYQAFEARLKKHQWLLLAHHQNDQAETLLLRLLRGCGLAGAGAMPACRGIGEGQLLRPLLDFTRAEIEDYATASGLSWLHDPSNQDNKYSRNFLRNEVLPAFAIHWPGYSKTLARFSQLAREQSELLVELAEEDWHKVRARNLNIEADNLARLSPARQRNLLHFWGIKVRHFAPSNNEINQVLKQLDAAINGASVKIDYADGLVRSYAGQLILTEKYEPVVIDKATAWLNFDAGIRLANGLTIEAIKVDQQGLRIPRHDELVSVRPREGGEKCLPDYRGKSASLKKIYQELAVPPWQRSWLPIIYYNEKIAAVPGVFIDKNFLSQAGQPAVQLQLKTGNL